MQSFQSGPFLYQHETYYNIGLLKKTKQFGSRQHPYIVAENPNIGAREAISLSRRMMKGHKWECFVADLSFLGWSLLNLFTLGLSGIFYSNGYRACARIVQGFGIGGKRAAQRRIPVQQGLR